MPVRYNTSDLIMKKLLWSVRMWKRTKKTKKQTCMKKIKVQKIGWSNNKIWKKKRR